jgi:hypothetical protein
MDGDAWVDEFGVLWEWEPAVHRYVPRRKVQEGIDDWRFLVSVSNPTEG